MKTMILSSMILAAVFTFTGCNCCAQDAKKEHKGPHPHPHAILIIDDVAYVDGCNGCECVEEAVCVCEEKADCECCRKHLKKAPKEKQEQFKAIKKEHSKQTNECKTCKKGAHKTACNMPDKDKAPNGK